jgi:L-ascorbate metabolism protein UlaG (beta-lactamase superfamily)
VGPPSDHFDGSSFHNVPEGESRDLCDLVRWQLQSSSVPWPEGSTAPRSAVPPARVTEGIRVTHVGHATTLVQLDGLSLLTDPVWSERVGPLSFAGPARFEPPGVALDDLPRIDAVLLSHSHYDHADAPTLAELARRFGMPIVGGLGTRAMLEDLGVPGGVDLDWWQTVPLGDGRRAHFVPVKHWSRRGLADQNVVLWGGFVVEAPSGRVYFAGDTAYGPHFAEAHARIGAPDVAILPIGAYLPRWFMAPMHMDPIDAVRAHLALGARRSVGVHWGTFDLADEGRFQPAGELGLALDRLRIPRRDFVAARAGDVVRWPDAPREAELNPR